MSATLKVTFDDTLAMWALEMSLPTPLAGPFMTFVVSIP